jgi:hypothetical protein
MNAYLDRLDEQIAARHLLTHPFYLAWTRGELRGKRWPITPANITSMSPPSRPISRPCTRAVTIKPTRRQLLANLIDEEAASQSSAALAQLRRRPRGFA